MSDGGDPSQAQQRPWASPRVQPIKGVVQPRVLPPFGKPTRHTNKLDYIMTVTLKEVGKHKHVWPFQKPVDAHALCIPLYHERVTRPMDLKTIESRLKSVYYTCAQECIDDIEQVFQNCYTFNGREDDVTIMAQNVHEVIKKSLEQAPREELDMEVHWGKNKKKGGGKDGNSGGKAVKKEARGPSEAPSEAGSETTATPAAKPERKVAGKKTGKRKADSDDEEKAESHRSKREVVTVKKEPTVPISPIMRPCMKLLTDFFGKKYADFAWVFYDPVDALTMGLSDYHTIIKHPMDMKTIKRKLETGVYKEPSDFEADVRLMINNCLTYNPLGDPVNGFGLRFQEAFNKRWAELEANNAPRPASVAPPVVAATPKVPKKESTKAPKEIKQEPPAAFFEQGGSAKSEDLMLINNALSMIREREDRLKAELAAAEAMKQKLTTVKNRREGNPNEPFPEKLITETRIMCTTPIGQGMFSSGAGGSSGGSTSASANSSANRNGRVKKSNPSARQYGYEFDSDDEENKPALTYDEKRNLSHMVNRLPPDQLSTIISIIQRRECSALNPESGVDDSEIELDFESLGDMCLREMGAFMRSLDMKEEKSAPTSAISEQSAKPSKTPSSMPTAGTSGSKTGSSVASSSKNDKKKKNFNMSESSDDETSNNRKRRKKESSESDSSTSSDDESDDEGPSVPRKSGQPPSTSREWNQSGPPPPARMGGMGGQPPMSRPAPAATIGKNAPSSSYQTTSPPTVKPAPASTPSATSSKTSKPASQAATTVSAGQPPKKKTATSILDTLLPDTFGSSSQMPGPTSSSNMTASPAQAENGENEEARINRLRMEAKRARQREDENSLSMTNQMEMMSAFEYDNTY